MVPKTIEKNPKCAPNNTNDNAKTQNKDDLHKELDEIIKHAQQEKKLTAIVTTVLKALRVLGMEIVRMVLEQRLHSMTCRRATSRARCVLWPRWAIIATARKASYRSTGVC
jgi:hypothetical protein